MERYQPAQIDELSRRFVPRMVPSPGALEGDAVELTGGPDLSPEAIAERCAWSRDFLLRFIRTEMGDDPSLIELAERTLSDGREGLELIGGRRDATQADPVHVEVGLEVIVRTDGSRPAFVVRDDFIVPDSSPPGVWTELLTDVTREDAIRMVLGSVGRVDITHPMFPFAGTGWLIAPDLIATNRHVAQLFVEFPAAGGARLKTELEPRIDFGHEFTGRDSVNRREITDIVFSGDRPVPLVGIDHSVLDLSIFRIAPAGPDGRQQPLALGIAPHLATPQTQVIVAGYPGRPAADALGSVSETDRVLRLLFGKRWGFKRLATGEIMPSTIGPRTLNHDASTLGGNSGSLVMGLDSIPAVTGIHYGGTWGGDRANWAHVIAQVMDEPGLPGLKHETLAALCKAEGVTLSEG